MTLTPTVKTTQFPKKFLRFFSLLITNGFTQRHFALLFYKIYLWQKDKFSIVLQTWMKWIHTTEHNQKHTKRFIKCMGCLADVLNFLEFSCIFCSKLETTKAIFWTMKIVKWPRNWCVRVWGIQNLFISVLDVLSKLYSRWICLPDIRLSSVCTLYTHAHVIALFAVVSTMCILLPLHSR